MDKIIVKGSGQADAVEVILAAGYTTQDRHADSPIFEKDDRRFKFSHPVWVMTPGRRPLRDVYLIEVRADEFDAPGKGNPAQWR